jgi:hypothetical protein
MFAMNAELERIVSIARSAAAGGFGVLSTGEKLVAALILNSADWLQEMDYTMAQAIERVGEKWLALIPTASFALRATDEALMNAAQRAKTETLFATKSSADEVLDYNAKLVTYGDAPGYRSVTLVFDVEGFGSEVKHRISLNINDPKDGEALVRHITEVNKLAWSRNGQPLDAVKDERKPSWIN